MNKVLTQKQRTFYGRAGYLAPVPALSASQVGPYREALLDTEARVKQSSFPILVQPHLHFRWAYQLATLPAVLDAVEDLLGGHILVHTTSVFHKEAGDLQFVSWHQDGYYWGLFQPAVVSAWIALSDSTALNGCLRVLPETQRYVYDHGEQRDPDNMLASGLTALVDDPERRAVDVILKQGDCSFHHVNLVHGSAPNRSNRDRIGFAVRYMPVGTRQSLSHHPVILARGQDNDGFYEHLARPPHDDVQGLSRHTDFAQRLRAFRLGRIGEVK